MKIIQEEPEIAEEPVQLTNRDDIETVLSRVAEKPLEFRPVIPSVLRPKAG